MAQKSTGNTWLDKETGSDGAFCQTIPGEFNRRVLVLVAATAVICPAMKRTTVLAYGATFGFLGLFVTGALIGGCKDDDKNDNRRLSQKGDSCDTSNDCANGLACRPRLSTSAGTPGAGICVTGVFHVEATTKECKSISCAQPADCCPPPTKYISGVGKTCGELLTYCSIDGGSNYYCDQYNLNCKCDAAKFDCSADGKCLDRCTGDSECALKSPSTPYCSGGKCAQCNQDSQCGSGKTCVNGACQGPCTLDSDCPEFDRCQAGKCVDSGCLSDRECIAATHNVEATCGTDRKCVVPCQTDLECGDPKPYGFLSCIDHKCIDTGCMSDKECELSKHEGVPPTDSRTKYVCRERKTAQ